jgi:hypothetical protein
VERGQVRTWTTAAPLVVRGVRRTLTVGRGDRRRVRAGMAEPGKCRFVIVPGNGCTPVEECNWYAWVRDELVKRGLECELKEMPDPMVRRSSGGRGRAAAASGEDMRLAEAVHARGRTGCQFLTTADLTAPLARWPGKMFGSDS